MPQGNVDQDSTQVSNNGGNGFTFSGTPGIKYRTINQGSPMSHNDVDTNFEILRLAVNTIVSDISGVEGKTLTSDLSEALLSYTSTGQNYAVQKDTSSKKLFVNVPWTDTDTVYTLPIASSAVLGGIKVGASLSIDSSGVLDFIIQDDAVTTNKIADGAVTGAKIANNTITSTQLASSVSTQLKVAKTVFVHVGNYYKDGTKYWASDSFFYNTTTGRYDARETTVLPFNHAEIPVVWGSYHSTDDAAIITEPFATVCAAARYVMHNHGHDCVIGIIVHGHVAWHGSYDVTGNTLLDVYNWESVKKLAITGGRSDDVTGSHYSTFPLNGFSSARIDVDHGVYMYGPGCWIRNPRVLIEGLCFTHKQTPSSGNNHNVGGFKVGGESKMFSAFSSIRMNALNHSTSGNDYFYPWTFNEGGDAYFSSSSNQPHELWTQGNMTIFQTDDAYILYSNNAGSNQLYLHTVGLNASIRMFSCANRGSIYYRHSQVQLKSGSNTPATNINTAGFYHAFNNLRIDPEFSTGNKIYFPGNLQTSITQFGGSSNGTTVNINTANVGGNYNYSDIALGSARTNYLATNTPSYYGSQYPSNTLYGKFTNEANNTSLSRSTLVGDGSTQNFKSAPSARTGTGGTSGNNAPYSDQ